MRRNRPARDAAASAPRSLWIIDPRRDLLLIVGAPLLIAPALWIAQAKFRPEQIYLFVASFGAVGHHLPGMMRAYGVPEVRIVRHFALRLALVPMIAVMGIGVGDMISNAVFVEVIFARPGVGRLIYEAILLRNFPVVQAGILTTVLIYVTCNMLVDIINAVIDPRIARSLKQAA